jgi:hypothetical protein
MNNYPGKVLVIRSIKVVAILIGGVASLVIALPASATPGFAQQTGKSCGSCHVSAKGGGDLTPYGEKFKANGNKIPDNKISGSAK